MRVLMIFIDGLGLGDDASENPLVATETPGLNGLLDGRNLTLEAAGRHYSRATLLAVDASLGVRGLPQSATGQASIFTGINAPALIGYHLNGFPNSALRRLLADRGIFLHLKNKGYRVSFLNAYRPLFFEALDQGLPGNRYSCSTLITYYAGLTFRDLDSLKKGDALYMDITNKFLQNMGFDVPEILPEVAGRRLAELSSGYDFSLFEYFLSDLAGHLASKPEAEKVIMILDRFLFAVTNHLDINETLLIVCSDHGNLEDISSRVHTANPTPALLVGPLALRRRLAARLNKLTDYLSLVEEALRFHPACSIRNTGRIGK